MSDAQRSPVAWLPIDDDLPEFVRVYGDGATPTAEQCAELVEMQRATLREAAPAGGFGVLYRTRLGVAEHHAQTQISDAGEPPVSLSDARNRARLAEWIAAGFTTALGLDIAPDAVGWALVRGHTEIAEQVIAERIEAD